MPFTVTVIKASFGVDLMGLVLKSTLWYYGLRHEEDELWRKTSSEHTTLDCRVECREDPTKEIGMGFECLRDLLAHVHP